MRRKIVTWILVADGGHANVFANDGPGRGLKPVAGRRFTADLPHSNLDADTDKVGRSWSGTGGGRHAVGPKSEPKRIAEQSFVREVAQAVGQAALGKEFDRLILVAPPKALGDLRNELPKQAQDLVTQTISKDLVRLDARTLAQHLVEAEVLV